MTRRLLACDRLAGLIVGTAFIVLALLAFDWNYDVVGTYPRTLRNGGVQSVLDAGWWPWAFAVAAIILGLLALAWILAHLRRPGPGAVRMSGSDETGRIETDMRSVAEAAADHLGSVAPLVNVTGNTRTIGGRTLVELRGHIDPAADASALTEGVRTCTEQITSGFPDEPVECRILVDGPRRQRPGRTTRVRVR